MKRASGLIFSILMLCSLAMAQQEFPTGNENNPRALLLAYRAARMDGLRQMAEAIKGLHIDSQTTVKDFVTQSDQINASLDAFVRGARDAAPPDFKPDGTCELTLVLDMNVVIAELKYLNQSFQGNQNFDGMASNNPQTPITVTGTGAIPSQDMPQFVGWENVTPQGKAMAKRGAQLDAYRNLGEVVMGVRIVGNTSVQDFVTQSDQIQSSFQGVVMGAQMSEAEYLPNGVVRVKARMEFYFVVENLRRLAQSYPSQQFQAGMFSSMQYPEPAIEVFGCGVANPEHYRWVQKEVPPQEVPPEQPPDQPQSNVPDWVGQTIRVTGTGAISEQHSPAQAKAMARRAAQLDGYRQVLEQVQGLHITSETTVKDFVTQHDEIKGRIEGWLKGVQVVATRFKSDGTVEVDMVLELRPGWNIIEPYYKK